MNNLYCQNCGTQLPDDTAFCSKCGKSTSLNASKPTAAASSGPVIAPSGVTSLKCPSCGAPITPKFGEMVITCQYCGSGVTLGSQGWTNLQKQTMLTLKVATVDQVNAIIKPLINKGILNRHRLEDSKQEEMSLTYMPYWIVSVSARTAITVPNQTAQLAQTATTAALMGVILGGLGGGGGGGGGRGGGRGGRRAYEGEFAVSKSFAGILGLKRIRIMGFGMGMGRGGGGQGKAEQMDENYNFPVIALKSMTDYQPRYYQFNLEGRELFDISKLPKGVKILNGDVSEEMAKNQAKTLVDQLQSQKAHAKYQTISSIHTDSDVGDVELLHVPVWFAKFDHKGKKIVLVIDANCGKVINGLGL